MNFYICRDKNILVTFTGDWVCGMDFLDYIVDTCSEDVKSAEFATHMTHLLTGHSVEEPIKVLGKTLQEAFDADELVFVGADFNKVAELKL